jgi:hypothetical protein
MKEYAESGTYTQSNLHIFNLCFANTIAVYALDMAPHAALLIHALELQGIFGVILEFLVRGADLPAFALERPFFISSLPEALFPVLCVLGAVNDWNFGAGDVLYSVLNLNLRLGGWGWGGWGRGLELLHSVDGVPGDNGEREKCV